MFYPVPDLDEIMPDVVAQGSEKKLHSNHKNRMGYFTRSGATKEVINVENNSSEFELKEVEQGDEGTKGNLPDNVISHPSISYSFRGDTVMLGGLDDSFSKTVVNNGTWRP